MTLVLCHVPPLSPLSVVSVPTGYDVLSPRSGGVENLCCLLFFGEGKED